MTLRQRQKCCDRCQQAADVLYRIRPTSDTAWQFFCQPCWTVITQTYPAYTYGGTWKAKKR